MNRPKMPDATTLRARLDAGEWLSPAQIAVLFGVKRWAVIGWMKSGKIPHRAGPTGYRTGDPEAVRRLLAEAERVRGTPDSTEVN